MAASDDAARNAGDDETDHLVRSKRELRHELSALRRARTDEDLAQARSAVAAVALARSARAAWQCVAAYVPLRTEPGSLELLTGLRTHGIAVLVPLVLPNRDLDWVEWLAPDRTGDRLGPQMIAAADAVLVPALAVARDGTRLGRGGGSYDRALPRATPGADLVALLFESELVASLPREPWDVPVTAAISPRGWRDLPIR